MQAKLSVTFRLFLFKWWLTSTSPQCMQFESHFFFSLFFFRRHLHFTPDQGESLYFCVQVDHANIFYAISLSPRVTLFLFFFFFSSPECSFAYLVHFSLCPSNVLGWQRGWKRQASERVWGRKRRTEREAGEDAHRMPFLLQLPMAQCASVPRGRRTWRCETVKLRETGAG